MRSLSKSLLVACVGMATAAPFAYATAQDAGNQSKVQTVADKTSDAWITTKVKSEFATTKGVSATDISVSTAGGVVTLSGSVASEHEKTKAARVAGAVKGVKSVDTSGLMVGGAMKSDGMSPPSGTTSGS